MTGVWSLGTEYLRNIESFWCPIRFASPKKCDNCVNVFPDIQGGWVPPDGSMADVVAVLEKRYAGENRSWFGHTSRLGDAPEAEPAAAQSEQEQAFQELLLEHSSHPLNQRSMADATHQAQGHTPICNDRIQVFLRLADGRIDDISFTSAACPICTASASMMTSLLRGKSQEDAVRLFTRFRELMTRPDAGTPADDLGDLRALAGIHRFPARIKCATLPWHAMNAAISANGSN